MAKQFADQEARSREAEGSKQKVIGKLKAENKELRNTHGTQTEQELEYDSIYTLPSEGTPIYLSLAFQDATSFQMGEIWLDKEKIEDITNLKNGQWEYTALKKFYPISGKILRVVTWSNEIAEFSTFALGVYPSTYYRFYPSGKESIKRFILQSKEPPYLKSGKFEVKILLKS